MRTVGRGIYIDPDDIIDLEADGSYTKISLQNGEQHYLSQNLASYGRQLDPDLFVRIHKSRIINLKHLKEVNQYESFVEMNDGRQFTISRRSKDHFVALLKKHTVREPLNTVYKSVSLPLFYPLNFYWLFAALNKNGLI
ncbi:LytTR family DNA-binding domain-containing protein [Paraflavitalea speifideaquila]|uniref:LytR/AlgR family response regulator transcription factor n=1 Tax=Paraflavitalea speifideaquila TaxID=3076558 RepID=UPI0028EFE261|nr:LytTR family DNA-binding domain-containing protein [Paraflavitalea speifideiaquila]